MAHYGLIGRKLGHSWSKRLFEERFSKDQHDYGLIEIERMADLGEVIESKGLAGFNVTIPYKQQILPLLDGLTPEAQEIGAVNAVLVQGRQLIGHNTDGTAFMETLEPMLQPQHRQALVLGEGGASKAVVWALRKLGIAFETASHRMIEQQQESLASQPFDILVNATPAGMFPDCASTPFLHPEVLGPRHLVYDLIYNPEATLLLQQAQSRGAQTCNGMPMLRRQAELSWEFWRTE